MGEAEVLKYEQITKLSLKSHPVFTELWVQDRIADNPQILGLGDVVLKDKERIQPRAGRLDLLLQDAEASHRYEVEVQLGKTDESHIIRTIEYWDIERKRYPQYEHSAVIVAEEITTRFLNVISLFNGTIPLIAIQMSAVQLSNTVSLLFTTVLDEVRLGLVDEDEEVREFTDRAYWEARGSKATVAMADEVLRLVAQFAPDLELKYNKFYIGLATNGQPNNFVQFRPQKNVLRVEVRLPQSQETEAIVEASGLDIMDYDKRWGRYRLRINKGDVAKFSEALSTISKKAFVIAAKDIE